MNTLDVLSEKINSLKESLEQLKESNLSEKNKIQAQIVIIEECEKAIGNDELMSKFDFSSAIELIESHHNSINNLSQIIFDIQSVLLVRKELNMSDDDIPFDESQVLTFNDFIDRLEIMKDDLLARLKEISETTGDDTKIHNLESLRSVLEGVGRRKYYTEDMFRDFYEEFDIFSLPPEQAQSLLEGFYQTKNLRSRHTSEKVDIEKVIELYREFLSPKKMRFFEKLLYNHSNEITSVIDLDNARDIMQFFKEHDILEKFRNTTLLKITLYGKADYIEEVVYPKVMANTPDVIETFYEDDLASIWIKEKNRTVYHSSPFRKSRGSEKEKAVDNLYPSCYNVDYDEFWENVEILRANRDLFGDQFDVEDVGAYLNLKTLPVWVLRKNIELCKIFGLGMITSLPPTTIERGDIEDKIHLAIELGLLNPPLNNAFRELDKNIVRSEEFQRNAGKKGLYNQSIRNYFQRYLGMLSLRSINEYAYMFYKLQTNGYEEFYNEFFSSSKAGKGNPEFFASKEKVFTNSDAINDFISDNFVSDWFSEYIQDYDEYDSVLSEYTDDEKGQEYVNYSYYDSAILEDPLIKELENHNTVMDVLTQNGDVVERKNDFVYLFGDRIISRYKVLHNASILKGLYGYLTKEMLMVSIVRNTFLDIEAFQNIDSAIMERGKNI